MSKKKTHEEYVNELKEKNPNIEVVEEYNGASTKITHKCKSCGYEWRARPSDIMRGKGCPECAKKKRAEKRTKTHSQYVEELAVKNPNLEVLGIYMGANTKIPHRCKIDDIIWDITPEHALRGYGCPECSSRKISNKLSKTHEDYVKELNEINSNLEVLGEYVGANTKILHRCKIDGYEWEVIPSRILCGSGCPICGGTLKKTHKQYVNEVKEININIEVIDEYVDAKTKIMHYCLIHEEYFESSPDNVLSGKDGCFLCANENRRKAMAFTKEEYVNKLKEVNPDVELIGDYINMKTKALHKCKLHNCIYETTPDYIISKNSGCPQCYETSGERKVRQWLEKNNIDYEFQKRFKKCIDKNELPFDFYLPQYNACIEYDGIQHSEPIDFSGKGMELASKQFETIKLHDSIKNNYCKDNNIKLLRIPYYKNVEEELNNFLFI